MSNICLSSRTHEQEMHTPMASSFLASKLSESYFAESICQVCPMMCVLLGSFEENDNSKSCFDRQQYWYSSLSHTSLYGRGMCSSDSWLPAAFENWAVEESWAHLVLPSDDEAREYFAGFRSSAAPLNDPSSSADSEIVQGMVAELHIIMKSARFSATLLVSSLTVVSRFSDVHLNHVRPNWHVEVC